MTFHLGRANLNTPLEVRSAIPRHAEVYADAVGRGTPAVLQVDQQTYHLRGRDTPATITTLETEGARQGSVYAYDDAVVIPQGWYELIEGLAYTKPGGAPSRRHWTLALQAQPFPFVIRQAENENVAGSDVADSGADGGTKVVYTPTTSEVKVLDPRNATGTERVNLPAGTYTITARIQSTVTFSQFYRAKLTDASGGLLVNGAQVTATAAGAWQILSLGSFIVPDANAGANWFELHVQGVAGQLNDVWLDRVRLVRQ